MTLDSRNQPHVSIPTPSPVTLRDGTRAILRLLVPADEPLIVLGFEHLSDESRLRRFLHPTRRLSESALHYLSHPDQSNHLALVLTTDPADGPIRGIGVARCIRLGEGADCAECAITVVDEWQRRGAGRLLARALADWSLASGIRRWTGPELVDNDAIGRVLGSVGEVHSRVVGDGVVECECALSPSAPR